MRTVDEEATVAQELRATDDSAGYDVTCKRALAEKAILARSTYNFWLLWCSFGPQIGGGKIMGFQVGAWWHEAPGKEFDAAGKRAIVKHLCFGPLETRTWYELKDGRYNYEVHFIEGMQARDIFVDLISRSEMFEVIKSEMILCQKYNLPELASLFQIEIERIGKQTI